MSDDRARLIAIARKFVEGDALSATNADIRLLAEYVLASRSARRAKR